MGADFQLRFNCWRERPELSLKVLTVFVLIFHFNEVLMQPLEIPKTIREELQPGFIVSNLSTEPQFAAVVSAAIASGTIIGNSSSGVALHYSVLTSGKAQSQYFAIDSSTGAVSIRKTIDRERVCSFRDECHLSFQVAARSIYGVFFQLVNFNIIITDINDNPPEFTQSQFDLNIPENTDVGRSFQLPTAFDRDTGANNRVSDYRILAGPSLLGLRSVHTGINSTDIFLVLEQSIEPENALVHKVLVGAVDGGKPPLTGTLTAVVSITDVNDNFPVFDYPVYSSRVPEIAGNGQVIAQVRATDADSGAHGQVLYSFSAQQPPEDLTYFRVDSKTGEIILTKSIEDRAGADIDLVVEARDGGHPPKISKTIVKLHVEDTINSVPNIIIDTLGGSKEHIAEVSEYAGIGKVVAYVSVYDPDSGDNGHTSCRLSGSEFELVKLDDEGKYKAELMSSLDRERKEMYNMTMTCTDSGFPPLMATSDFAVKVLDENDHEPVFSQRAYEASVYENNTVGAFLVQLEVTDKDIGDNAKVSFEIIGTNKMLFNIDDTGRVMAKMSLDREYSDKITATVIATDKGNPPLSSFATLTVRLLDINDMQPEFSRTIYSFEVEEDRPLSSLVGILEAYDIDVGNNKEVMYRIQESRLQRSDAFTIGQNDGVIRVNAALDREQKDIYSFIVLAVDKGVPPLTGTASVIIRVLDVNDNNPYFIHPTVSNNTIFIPHSTESKTKIYSVQAHDIDADLNSKIIYSISSVNRSMPFIIDSINGALFTKDRFSRSDTGLYILTLMANDQGPKQQRATQIPFHIHVYFDNSTVFAAATGSDGLSVEVVVVLIVVPLLLLIIFVISLALLCVKRRKTKKVVKSAVPNSASTSSTAKLQGGYYIAPGVRDSSSSFIGKNDEAPSNNNGVQESVDRSRNHNRNIVVLSRTEPETPAEIVEISINANQNGMSGTLERNRYDDDRFSTFRSQEDILATGLRYGSLRRQDKENSCLNKRTDDSFDDLSCDGSTSDSGRGGSDLEVNNNAAAAATAKSEKARTKAGTPISIKSGISHRLSPLPFQEKTLITFRGESPNSFKIESDNDSLPRGGLRASKSSSVFMTSSNANSYTNPNANPNTNKDLPIFVSGLSSAFSDPSNPHQDSRVIKTGHLSPLVTIESQQTPTHEFGSFGHHSISQRLASPSMAMPAGTHPSHRVDENVIHHDISFHPNNSLTRRNPFPRQIHQNGGQFPHHALTPANGSKGNNNVYISTNEKTDNNPAANMDDFISKYELEAHPSAVPIFNYYVGDRDYNSENRLGNTENRLGTTENRLGNIDNRLGNTDNRLVNTDNRLINNSGRSRDRGHLLNYDLYNARKMTYLNADSRKTDPHPPSVEEDFLLPPYPEVDLEDDDVINIHPGYTGFNPEVDAEKSALFSKSRYESHA